MVCDGPHFFRFFPLHYPTKWYNLADPQSVGVPITLQAWMRKMLAERVTVSVEYPSHRFDPEDFVHFIETRQFTKAWKDLKLSVDELLDLQLMLMADPKCGFVIPGTNGLRKVRYAPKGWRKSKRDALRVCYAFLEEYQVLVLAIVYSKNVKDDLSVEQRRLIRDYIARQKLALSLGVYS